MEEEADLGHSHCTESGSPLGHRVSWGGVLVSPRGRGLKGAGMHSTHGRSRSLSGLGQGLREGERGLAASPEAGLSTNPFGEWPKLLL